MNPAEILLRKLFRVGEQASDVFSSENPLGHIHPNVHFSLFGPSGTKELLIGREAYLEFVSRCGEALANHQDEIVAITGIDQECAFVRARAWRRSKASGEELRYEWAMLYRVENGMITYGTDMLDSDAQLFWGRILRP